MKIKREFTVNWDDLLLLLRHFSALGKNFRNPSAGIKI